MKFCKEDKCYYYAHDNDKYPRRCFYEPQCWKGFLDRFLFLIKLRFNKHDYNKGEVDSNDKD